MNFVISFLKLRFIPNVDVHGVESNANGMSIPAHQRYGTLDGSHDN